MAVIECNQSFNAEIRRCDEQYDKLIELVNDLHEQLNSGKGRDEVGRSFRSTIAFAKAHFKEEEKLMRAHGYPALDEQKQSHELFVIEVKNLFSQFKSGGILTVSIKNFLKRLEHHIMGDDRSYCRFVNSKGLR
jgi:hemerythrin-like metal-binding protein